MAELEKVIYSIERCTCHVPDACRDCGYDNEPYPKCFEHLLRDALSLLKAQEPRVMTLEEVVSHGDKEAMYLEHMDSEMIVRPVVLLTTFLDLDKDYLHFAGGWRCCGGFRIDGYGKTWRCWTSRPSDSERENTPWE